MFIRVSHTRVEPVPGWGERLRTRVVDYRREKVKVKIGRFPNKFIFRQGRSSNLHAIITEVLVQVLVQLNVAKAELLPL